MTERAPAPDVVTSSQVREILGGISRTRLSQLVNDPAGNFPMHTNVPGAGYGPIRVWDRPSVVAWQQARTRPKRRAIYLLLTQTGRGISVATAAKSAGISRSTANAWLRELRTNR